MSAIGLSWLESPAQAASSPAVDVAKALAADPSVVTSATYLTTPPNGSPNAVETESRAGFPTAGGSYALLTTGDADTTTAETDDDGGDNVRGDTDFDVTVLSVSLNVPAGVNCMAGMDFRYLSAEFPNFVGTTFNDAFIAEMDTTSWTTSGSAISAPNNFAFDPTGNPITVNAAGATSMSAANATGTPYGGATPLLTAATPITPGPHTLYLSIFDQGDHALDSAVMLDNLRFAGVANVAQDCIPGASTKAGGPKPAPAPAPSPKKPAPKGPKCVRHIVVVLSPGGDSKMKGKAGACWFVINAHRNHLKTEPKGGVSNHCEWSGVNDWKTSAGNYSLWAWNEINPLTQPQWIPKCRANAKADLAATYPKVKLKWKGAVYLALGEFWNRQPSFKAPYDGVEYRFLEVYSSANAKPLKAAMKRYGQLYGKKGVASQYHPMFDDASSVITQKGLARACRKSHGVVGLYEGSGHRASAARIALIVKALNACTFK